MSISALSGSSTYASSYTNSHSTSRRKSSGDDPMSQAISQLQSSDPTLASKLTDLQKQVETMKKSGASEKDVQSTMESTMDGLSDTEKTELKSAMPARPSGGPQGPGGPGGPPPAGGPPPSGSSSSSNSDDEDDSTSSSNSFSLSSFLDSAKAMQNDSIMGFMSARTTA